MSWLNQKMAGKSMIDDVWRVNNHEKMDQFCDELRLQLDGRDSFFDWSENGEKCGMIRDVTSRLESELSRNWRNILWWKWSWSEWKWCQCWPSALFWNVMTNFFVEPEVFEVSLSSILNVEISMLRFGFVSLSLKSDYDIWAQINIWRYTVIKLESEDLELVNNMENSRLRWHTNAESQRWEWRILRSISYWRLSRSLSSEEYRLCLPPPTYLCFWNNSVKSSIQPTAFSFGRFCPSVRMLSVSYDPLEDVTCSCLAWNEPLEYCRIGS